MNIMFKEYLVQEYDDNYYKHLEVSYVESFNRKFLSKEEYSKRFKYKKKYSSFLLINKKNESLIGHIGFKLNNLNKEIGGKIAFRFSTFISPKYRGTGIYKFFMDKIKKKLVEKYGVKFIFAWPNFNNLLSCLKDPTYLNQAPIITWHHKLRCNNYIYEISKGYLCEDLCINKSQFTAFENKANLTFDSYKDIKLILFDRQNKKYKMIYKGNSFAIIGESISDDIVYLSIVFLQDISIKVIISILNSVYKSGNVIVQIWCNPKDRFLQRSIIKSNFLPNGPIFNNGIYELTEARFPFNQYFPNMYNHDAF